MRGRTRHCSASGTPHPRGARCKQPGARLSSSPSLSRGARPPSRSPSSVGMSMARREALRVLTGGRPRHTRCFGPPLSPLFASSPPPCRLPSSLVARVAPQGCAACRWAAARDTPAASGSRSRYRLLRALGCSPSSPLGARRAPWGGPMRGSAPPWLGACSRRHLLRALCRSPSSPSGHTWRRRATPCVAGLIHLATPSPLPLFRRLASFCRKAFGAARLSPPCAAAILGPGHGRGRPF